MMDMTTIHPLYKNAHTEQLQYYDTQVQLRQGCKQ
jgi:hypothetical protein